MTGGDFSECFLAVLILILFIFIALFCGSWPSDHIRPCALCSDVIPKKRVLLGGGSGFVGQALASSLRRRGYDVKIISRDPKSGDFTWEDIERDGLPPSTDAVINLAGSSILDFKNFWTCKYMEECVSSRVSTTAMLAKAIAASEDAPSVWISTSSVSFYPPSKDLAYDETSVIRQDRDWASQLMASVEKAAGIFHHRSRHDTRSVIMRTGIVLGQDGGVYDNLQRPFYSCLGGTFGDGSQWFPYVHLKDVVRAYEFALSNVRAKGAFNVVAPRVCTNKEFTKAVGGAINRIALIRVPGFMSRVMGKERAPMLFSGQNVKPKALTSMGFKFDFPDVTSCCADLASGK